MPRASTGWRSRNAQARLTRLRAERSGLTEQLHVVEAQLHHTGEVASDAQIQAVVSATPLAARDHRVAASDEQRVRRERDQLLARLAEIDREQDRLLDRIVQERR